MQIIYAYNGILSIFAEPLNEKRHKYIEVNIYYSNFSPSVKKNDSACHLGSLVGNKNAPT